MEHIDCLGSTGLIVGLGAVGGRMEFWPTQGRKSSKTSFEPSELKQETNHEK
jgi:hypothetical protein